MKIHGKKVIVTGADGFIGSHLTELLVDLGAHVKALSYYNSFNNWGWLEELDCLNEIEVVAGDIRDPHFCNNITRGIDIIFHLAALIGIPYSYIAPDNYVETNIKGTLNICQAALSNKCERVIHTSTSEVYGTAMYVPIDEKHPIQPQSPYSASKIGADSMAMSFFNAFDLPITIARPFNTYGPRQSARAVIPSIIIQIANSQKQINLGDLSPTRDFSYAEDTCRGMIALAECENAVGEIVNIGSNNEISIKDLFNIIKEKMHADVEAVTDRDRFRPEKSEVHRLWCDNTKIKSLAGFIPEYDIEEGLEKTIAWFSCAGRLNKYKANIYNV